MPGQTTLHISQGSGYQRDFQLVDSTGAAINVTAYAGAHFGSVRRDIIDNAGALVTTFTVTVVTPSSGIIRIAMTAAQTRAIKQPDWKFQVKLVSASAPTPWTAMEGDFIIDYEVAP